MGKYVQEIIQLRAQYNQAMQLKAQIDSYIEHLSKLNSQYTVFLEAQ